MKALFQNILQIDDVLGALFIKPDGTIAYCKFSESLPVDPQTLDGPSLVSALAGYNEAELVFEKARFFIRRIDSGIIVVMAGHYALFAMIRLNCDILAPALDKPSEKPKGLRRFFSRS